MESKGLKNEEKMSLGDRISQIREDFNNTNEMSKKQNPTILELDIYPSDYDGSNVYSGEIKIGEQSYGFIQNDISRDIFPNGKNDPIKDGISLDEFYDIVADAIQEYENDIKLNSRSILRFDAWCDNLPHNERPEVLESIISEDMLPKGFTDVNIFIDSFMKDEYKIYVGQTIKDIYSKTEPGIKYIDTDTAFKLNEINQGFNKILSFEELKQFYGQLGENNLEENQLGKYIHNHVKEVVEGINKCNLMLKQEQSKKVAIGR